MVSALGEGVGQHLVVDEAAGPLQVVQLLGRPVPLAGRRRAVAGDQEVS